MSGLALQHVTIENQTQEIIQAAFQQNPRAAQYILDTVQYINVCPLVEDVKDVRDVEDSECCVCYETCNTVTRCKHRLCRTCYDNLRIKTCPCCRRNLLRNQ